MFVTKTWGMTPAALLGALVGLGGGAGGAAGGAAWAESPAGAAASAPQASPTPQASPNPPINEIHCVGESCEVGACVALRMFSYAANATSHLRVIPNLVAGQPHGFKLYGIRPASWPAQLGLLNGDTALSVNGKELNSPQLALDAFMDFHEARQLTLALERAGKPFRRQLHFDRRPLTDRECPLPVAPPLPGLVAPANPEPPKQLPASTETTLRIAAKEITCKATRCTLSGALLDQLLADQTLILSGGRVAPTVKDGKTVGLRLTAIRPGSLWALLGLQNGDRVHSLNQFNLTTPEEALQAYVAVRSAAELQLNLERQGAPLTLTYVIKR